MPETIRGEIKRAYEQSLKTRNNENDNKTPLVTSNILEFCKNNLHWNPYHYQEKLLQDTAKFVAVRWARQSGKSTTLAVLALYTALSTSQATIVITGPSLRQARLIVQKCWTLAHKMHGIFKHKPLKGRLDFRNGSCIQALPDSPETIRGQTCHLVILDEFNFVKNDKELYDSVVFTLMTTNGRAIAASTPGSPDSIFYHMCKDTEGAFANVSRHHVNYREATEPNGPIRNDILNQLKTQFEPDPTRWTREMEAEFGDEDDVWLPMELIMRAVDPNLKALPDDFFTRKRSDSDQSIS